MKRERERERERERVLVFWGGNWREEEVRCMQEFREREFPFLSFESKDPTNTASEKKIIISEGDKKIKRFSVAGT